MEETTALLLRFECDRLDLLTDELFLYDVLTVLDDPRYFIFEEELKELGRMRMMMMMMMAIIIMIIIISRRRYEEING